MNEPNLSEDHLAEAIQRLSSLMTAYWKPQTIHAAVKLRLFDHLDPPQTIDQLAAKLNLPQRSLTLLIRALISLDLLKLHPNGTLSLTPLGSLLNSQHPHSLVSIVHLWATHHYTVWRHLSIALQTEHEQFSKEYHSRFFDWLSMHAAELETYQEAMSLYALVDYRGLSKYLQLEDHTTILDIGGGIGTLLLHLFKEKKQLHRYVLFDLPKVIEYSRLYLQSHFPTFFEHVDLVGGDFFKDSLPKADYYFMSRILHDWNDTAALSILRNVAQHMPSHSKLFILERLLPERLDDPFLAFLNLNLLVAVGSYERTLAEYKRLLQHGSLYLEQCITLPNRISILVVSKSRTIKNEG